MRALLLVVFFMLLVACSDNPSSANKNNSPPSADFSISTNNTDTSAPVIFDANSSADNEQSTSTLNIRWDWNGDGTWDTEYSKLKSYTYQFPYNYTFKVIMEVSDSGGLTDTASTYIRVICDSMEVIDIDGNQYTAVNLGGSWWLTENLRVTHFQNGDPISKITNDSDWSNLSEAAYCSYQNKPANSQQYGNLFNWFAVNDERNIAPAGWHVATDEEWQELEMIFGMNKLDADSVGYRGTDQSINLQQPDFSALFGGIRLTDGSYTHLEKLGYWWSSTVYCSLNAWLRGISNDYNLVYRNLDSKKMGLSVRCVKD